ncbi:hypothetical protein J6590_034134 [Homalodisca vitripennis]|nr:hypothetical protein J6590_034134 [Homalodisca vitripennis]
MAYIEDVIWNDSNTTSFACGGSIINDKYILTAAHCFMHEKIISGQYLRKITNVILGEHALRHVSYCRYHRCASPPVMATVERLYVHPAYTVINPVTGVVNDNDIALIRLAHPIRFTDNIRPICLPTAYGQYLQQFAETTYTAAGWGRTPGGPASDTLMAVKVPVVSNEACEISRTKNLYERHLCPRGATCRTVISDKQICAGGIQGEGVCQGDSGGPLMMSVGLNPTTYFVVGITSHVMTEYAGGCGSGVPDMYTRRPPPVSRSKRKVFGCEYSHISLEAEESLVKADMGWYAAISRLPTALNT